jgi:tyrosine-protein kinase Etk/Wzc
MTNIKMNMKTVKKTDYFELLITPLKHKVLIIIINSIVLLISILIMILSLILPSEISYLPNIYSSEAKILIPAKEEKGIEANQIRELANTLLFNLDRDTKSGQMMIGILNTNTVIDGVIENYLFKKKPRLKELYDKKVLTRKDIRKIVLKSSEFEEDPATGFIYIRYKDIDPVVAKEMVDAFLEMLSTATHDFSLTQTIFKKRFVEERLEEIRIKLEVAEGNYIAFQKRYGIISPENEAQLLATSIAALRAELMKKEAELENYKRTHTDESGNSELKFEIENIKENIIKLTSGTGSKMSELSSQYKELKQSVENLQTLHDNLQQELELTKLQEKNEGPVIQILDPPEIPVKKSGPSRLIILLKIIAASFAITISVPILIQYFKVKMLENPAFNNKVKILRSYLSFKKQ